jgi:hypothetical protein
VTVYAVRRDGFSGEIRLALKDAPPGVSFGNTRLAAGQDQVRVTVSARLPRPIEPLPLSFEGRATVDGREAARPAVPADDLMQAFLYRHLVCAKELVLTPPARPNGGWRSFADTAPTSQPQNRGQVHAK